MTPYTWRNFVTGASTAREGQMGRFFLQKRHFIHKLSVKKQETGHKTGKNPPKKGVFISPFDQLAEFATFGARREKLATFGARREKLATPLLPTYLLSMEHNSCDSHSLNLGSQNSFPFPKFGNGLIYSCSCSQSSKMTAAGLWRRTEMTANK